MLMKCYLPSISHLASLDLVCLLLCTFVMPLLYDWYICTCKQLVWGRGFQHHSGKSSRKPSSQPGQTCYLAQHHHCTEEVSCYFTLQKGVLLLKKDHSEEGLHIPSRIPLHPHLLHPESKFVKGALHKSQETWKVQCYHTIVPLYLLWTYYIRPF